MKKKRFWQKMKKFEAAKETKKMTKGAEQRGKDDTNKRTTRHFSYTAFSTTDLNNVFFNATK